MDYHTSLILVLICLIHSIAALQHYGCFKVDKRNRGFHVNPGDIHPDDVTPTLCATKCGVLAYQYCSLEYGMFCFCGHNPAHESMRFNTSCTTACRGDPSQTCGGGKQYADVYTTSPPIVGLQASADKGVTVPVKTHAAVTISSSVQSAGLDSTFRVDLDNGAGRSLQNPSGSWVYFFRQPGDYYVTVIANDHNETLVEKRSQVTVQVDSPVVGATVTCDEHMGTFEKATCNLEYLKGSYVKMEVQKGNDGTEEMDLADADLRTAGEPIPIHAPEPGVDPSSSDIVCQASEFQYSGQLIGVEYFAEQTGLLTFKVLRPSCANYCHSSNTCENPCQGAYDNVCGSADRYCILAEQCWSGGMCTSPSRYDGTQRTDLTAIYTKSISVGVAGPGYVDITDGIQITPGCLLAFSGITLSAVTGTADNTDVITTDHRDKTSSSSFPSPKRHNLRAYISQGMKFEYTFTCITPVMTTMTFTLTNERLPEELPTVLTKNINCVEGVNVSKIIIPTYIRSLVDVPLALAPHTGTSLWYYWTITKDGVSTYVNATSPNSVFTFTRGIFTVTVVIENVSSRKEDTKVIIAQEKITQLGLTKRTCIVDEPCCVNLFMSHGTDYTCQWSTTGLFEQSSEIKWLHRTAQTTDATTPPDACYNTTFGFEDFDTYQVCVTCTNGLGTESSCTSIRAWERITGVIVRTGALAGQKYYMEYTGKSGGKSLQHRIIFNNQEMTLVQDKVANQLGAYRVRSVETFPAEFNTTMTYPLLIILNNTVSSQVIDTVFGIDTRIENPSVTPSFSANVTILAKGESINFDITIDSGTNPTIRVAWGDGTDGTWPGPPWNPSHAYTTLGNFSIQVEVKNSLSSFSYNDYRALVVQPVVNLRVTASSATVHFDPPGYVTFQISQTVAGDIPNMAQIAIDDDSRSTPAIHDFQLDTPIPHELREYGILNVKFNISNPQNFLILDLDITVIEKIEGLQIIPQGPHAPRGQPFAVDVKIERAGTGSGVTLQFDPGNGPAITQARSGVSPDVGDTFTVTYLTVGTYTITVTATSSVQTVTETITFECQDVVTTDFTFITEFPLEYSGTASLFQLQYNSDFATAVQFKFDFGDGTISTPQSLSNPTIFKAIPLTTYHTYLTDGDYKATVTIWNLASTQSLTINSGRYKDFTGLSVVAKYRPLTPLNSQDMDGFGVPKNIFLLELPVKFFISFTEGTFVYHEVVASSASAIIACNKTTKDMFELDFSQSGTYTVTITTRNYMFDQSVTTTVAIHTSTIITSVTDNGATLAVGATKTINVNFNSIGDQTCVHVSFGNGNILLLGDTATCLTRYNAANVTNFHVASIALMAVTILTHQYDTAGSFTVDVTSFNIVSDSSAYLSHVVSQTDCSRPTVSIRTEGFPANFLNPLKFKKGRSSSLIGDTTITCAITFNNKKQWIVEQISDSDITIMTVSVRLLSSSETSVLAMPPNFLEYGRYKVTYQITMLMSGTDSFTSSAHTYILIEPSDLVGVVLPGSMALIERGEGQEVTISPGEHSFDPDVPRGDPQGFTRCEWFCRKLSGSFDDDITSKPLTTAQIAASSDNGGCFRKGNGRIDIAATDLQLTFNTENMHAGETYEFKVILHKESRSVQATAKLKIVSFIPPIMVPECGLASQCTPLISSILVPASTTLTLLARCTDYCTDVQTYTWTVSYPFYPWGHKPILSSELRNYVKDDQSMDIEFTPRLFEAYPQVSEFLITLDVGLSTGETTSVEFNIRANRAPSGGSCTISPATGTVTVTEFSMICSGWTDDDGVSEYTFFLTTSGNDDELMMGTTIDPAYTAKLPQGPSYDNYIQHAYVRIKDTRGASVDHKIGEVQVNALSEAALESLLSTLTSGDHDHDDEIYASGDVDDVCLLVLEKGAVVNQYSKTILAELGAAYTAGLSTPTFYSQGYENPQKPDPNIPVNETLKAQAEKMRNDGAMVVTQAMQNLEFLPLRNKQAVAAVASVAASMVSETPECVPRAAQTALANTAAKLIDRTLELLDEGVDMFLSERQAIAESVIAMLMAGRAAGSIGYSNPTDMDLEDAKGHEYYDTAYDSDAKPMPAGMTDPDEAKNKLLHFTNEDMQSSLSSSVDEISDKAMTKINKLLMDGLVTNGEDIVIKSGTFATQFKKNSIENLSGNEVDLGGAKIKSPDFKKLFPNMKTNTPVYSQVEVSVWKVPALLPGSSGGHDIGSVTFSLYDENQTAIEVRDIKERIEITIPRDRTAFTAAPEPEKDPYIPDRPWEHFYYSYVQVDIKGACIQARFEILSGEGQLLVVVRTGGFPNITTGHVEHVCLIPSTHGATDEASLTCSITTDMLGGLKPPKKVYFGIRELHASEYDLYRYPKDLPTSFPKEYDQFNVTYAVQFSVSNCLYVNETTKSWDTNGCYATEKTNRYQVNCLCTHMTTFTGGWAVAPNTIDWNFVFSNMDFFKNPTLYITEMVIAAVYIVVVIWARRQDKRDVEKLGIAPLLDNDKNDKYYYEIVVVTGMRRKAGTDSKINFILSGDQDETEVRSLADNRRKVFRRGGVDGFLMAVKKPLGPINYLHIWHDNSGKGNFASWYMNSMVVRDVQTNDKFIFINNKWFAVEEGDGQIDRVIPVAGNAQMTEFSHLFAEKTTKSLNDGHLWFSVLSRPPQSRFTRVQRVSCCLCLLYVTMLTNAMFYESAGAESGNSFTFGPFSLSATQVYIGVICNVIVFPVNFLIVFIFRRSKPRSKRPSRVEEAIKTSTQSAASVTDVNPRLKSANTSRVGSSMSESEKRPETSLSHAYTSLSVADVTKGGKKKKKKLEFPWYFIIVGWIVLWISVLVSAAFVTFYGVMFQDLKCKQWITSMLISFFASVFITQPVKVFAVAIFFSLIIKNPGGEEEEEDPEDEEKPKNLASDEEFLHMEYFGMGATKPRKAAYVPADTQLLQKSREVRLKEIKMWAVIREIIFYSFFVWILMVISYQNRSSDAYRYKFSMEQVFIVTNDTSHKFVKITNVQNFWTWAKSGLATGIRANKWYNDDNPLFLRGYINDKVSRLMGYATMRQLRSKKDTCRIADEIAKVIPECNGEYTIMDQDEQEYQVGWKPMYDNTSDVTREEYRYTSASVLNGYPYWGQMAMYAGGGYLVRLRGSSRTISAKMAQLEEEEWIDKYTRAIFVEFTVYNPGVNLFAISTLLAEVRPSNGFFPSYRFEPATLLPYMNSVMLFQIACEITYLIFTVYFVVREVRSFIRLKINYFKQFWNLIECSICGMSVTSVVLYFYRLIVTNTLTERFKHTHGNEYMKFQYVGYWSEIFSYIIGWLVFFGTLKFLKLLRFNKKMSLLASTLKNSCKDLLHFSIIFNIVFLAFVQFFYLIYVGHIRSFSTFITAVESGVVMMMGKFEIYKMLAVNPILTQVSLFLYVVAITFIVVNMFLSILNETFSAVRLDIDKQNNDYEIVQFMIGRFKLWTGIGKADGNCLKPDDVRKIKQESLAGKIDEFPDRIDRLLNSISNVYMEKDRIDSLFEMNARGGKGAALSKGALARGPFAEKPGKFLTTVQTN